VIALTVGLFFFAENTQAAPVDGVYFDLPGVFGNDSQSPQESAVTIQTLFLLTILALVPSILLMMTCFPRIIIVLHFTRSALGTQQMPPNQVLVGMALFLTLFIMSSYITLINQNSFSPLARGEINQEQALEEAMTPLRGFMFNQVKQKEIDMFSNMANIPYTKDDPDSIPNSVLIPAFMVSEIKAAFTIGVFIYLPFIAIDMVVASVLMAMGMMMLPPAMISLPFKILLFVLVDGWNMILTQIFNSFAR
jgi:flagellar biosynthetic protein FliP